MNYKNYFNRNKVFDNSYTCLHFSDKMKVQIPLENRHDENKVIISILLSEIKDFDIILKMFKRDSTLFRISLKVHRKSVKRGFEFTLMVVGESGLGKSTLVDSLFLSDLYANRKIPPVEERVNRTTEIEKTTMEIEEKGVKVKNLLIILRLFLLALELKILSF